MERLPLTNQATNRGVNLMVTVTPKVKTVEHSFEFLDS